MTFEDTLASSAKERRVKMPPKKTKTAPARKSAPAKRGSTRAPIRVTKESTSGRNEQFRTAGGRNLSRSALVREIEQGLHPNHHVRVIKGTKTPVSNPDGNTANNLDDD